jgi:uncharacterized membrane protein YfcA
VGCGCGPWWKGVIGHHDRVTQPGEIIAIFAAGVAAGTVNTIVGSGSLITFPTLLAFGYAPVVANVSNTIGLVPGSISGVIGYRRELAGQGGRSWRLGIVAIAGGLSGAALLLLLPGTFQRIVPYLVLGATLLVAVQPWLTRTLPQLRTRGSTVSPPLLDGVYLAGVYGGYFGAAQGVILISLLGLFLDDDIQRLNAQKNVITMLVNGAAAAVFVVFATVAWLPALLLALGSIVGGQLGAALGRRIPPTMLRGAIIIVGLLVGVRLLIG